VLKHVKKHCDVNHNLDVKAIPMSSPKVIRFQPIGPERDLRIKAYPLSPSKAPNWIPPAPDSGLAQMVKTELATPPAIARGTLLVVNWTKMAFIPPILHISN